MKNNDDIDKIENKKQNNHKEPLQELHELHFLERLKNRIFPKSQTAMKEAAKQNKEPKSNHKNRIRFTNKQKDVSIDRKSILDRLSKSSYSNIVSTNKKLKKDNIITVKTTKKEKTEKKTYIILDEDEDKQIKSKPYIIVHEDEDEDEDKNEDKNKQIKSKPYIIVHEDEDKNEDKNEDKDEDNSQINKKDEKKQKKQEDEAEKFKIQIEKKYKTEIKYPPSSDLHKFDVKTSQYYMNNRKIFIEKIAGLFRPYKKEIEELSENITCETMNKDDLQLLTHQKVIRDYLNLYTPYRGLLLYMGLGTGKSCTSIAVAESMKSQKQIVVMTPASLKKNFFNELKKCGDILYRKNQYWEFITIGGRPHFAEILSQVLNIPVESIKRNGGAWLVKSGNLPPNFSKLIQKQQNEIDEQIDAMIRTKYIDINYNGLTREKFQELTDNYTKNIFSDRVVIIDEAHNMVSRIINSIKKLDSLSYKIYEMLMSAENCKIVLLSGTPIINYPNEIGILFNILRGYIKRWTFKLVSKNKLSSDIIIKILEKDGFNTHDIVEFSGNNCTITRNPFGFINLDSSSKLKGGDSKVKPKKSWFNFGITKKENTSDYIKNRTKKNAEVEPENRENIISDLSEYKIVNGVLTITPTHEDEIITEDESVEFYKRTHEGDIYNRVSGGSGKNGVILDETGNISDTDFITEIQKIFNENQIRISGEPRLELLKALPDDAKEFNRLFVDSDNAVLIHKDVFQKRILGLSSYFRSANEKLMPRIIHENTTLDKLEKHNNKAEQDFDIVKVEMSEYQFSKYENIRKEEAKIEKSVKLQQKKKTMKGILEESISSSYRIFSRAVCNFAFPEPPGRPMPEKKSHDIDAISSQANIVSSEALTPDIEPDVKDSEDNDDEEPIISKEYKDRINAALKMLAYDPKKTQEEQYLSRKNLSIYSPKFKKILENITNTEYNGLHLLYSQFRTLEGIGIIKLMLETNGFSQFIIKKSEDDNEWEIIENEEDTGKQKFVLYTGTESTEEKDILLNVYNSAWSLLPPNISKQLRKRSSNNFYGEIIKLLCITSGGTEGINLKNTRFVHMCEPYWNNIRLKQTIGRARRICSHQDLPEEDKTVRAFLYLSVFSEKQLSDKTNIELMLRDVSRIDGNPITTDQSLFETANVKDKINNEILNAIKTTAVDCSLYSKENNIVCYNYGEIDNNLSISSSPNIETDLGEILEGKKEERTISLVKTKPIKGIIYAFDKVTMKVYSLNSYELYKLGNGSLEKVGNFIEETKGSGKFKLQLE